MKIVIFILLLLFNLVTFGQVQEIAPAEYRCVFLDKKGTAYVQFWVNGVGLKLMPFNGSHQFVEINGGLYNFIMRKATGEVFCYENTNKNLDLRPLLTDTLGLPFKAIAVECHLQTYYAIRSDGTIWMQGYDTPRQFRTTSEAILKKWAKIPGQPTVKFKTLVKGGANGNGVLVAVTEDGTVYTVNDKSTTWQKKALPGPVQKVYASTNNFYLTLIDNLPYGWGAAKYLTNGTGTITNYVALEGPWELDGRINDMAVNDHTIHYIDDQDRLWGMGDNSMGEVGIGEELVNRQEIYKGKQYVWGWVEAYHANYQQIAFVPKPVQILPSIKFARIWAGGYYAFYVYYEDVDGNIYSGGRNKSGVLSNGLAINNESDLPNWGDVVTPTKVTPFSTVTPTSGLFVPGTLSAGPDQTIGMPSTTLSGTATPSRGKNFTYTITRYKWSQLSGPACAIESPESPTTKVAGMVTGAYKFLLHTTDIQTGTMADTVVVSVAIVNKPPTVEVLCNKVVIDKSIFLQGKASDTDGNVVSVRWEKISGPAGDTIADPANALTKVSFGAPGEYTYRFTATDDKGANSTADITLIVYPIGDQYIIIRK